MSVRWFCHSFGSAYDCTSAPFVSPSHYLPSSLDLPHSCCRRRRRTTLLDSFVLYASRPWGFLLVSSSISLFVFVFRLSFLSLPFADLPFFLPYSYSNVYPLDPPNPSRQTAPPTPTRVRVLR